MIYNYRVTAGEVLKAVALALGRKVRRLEDII
jgi:hypothetical protein